MLPRAPVGALMGKTGLLLVGHGSQSNDGVSEISSLVTSVRAHLPEVEVELGFLELAQPGAIDSGLELLSRKLDRLVVVPLMLSTGGHVKSDVPAVALYLREQAGNVEVLYGRSLGIDFDLLDLAKSKINEHKKSADALLVISRGTSDPDSNADTFKIARLLCEMTNFQIFEVGFSGITWPTVQDALDLLASKGSKSIVAFAWFLGTGILIERMQQDFEIFEARSNVPVYNAGYFGPEARISKLIVERFYEALDGDIRMNCDVCAYRRPFAGLEDRIGLPIGVGHSGLAAEHSHISLGHRH